MRSTMMTLVRQIGCAPKTFSSVTRAVMIGLAGLAMTVLPASAFIGGADGALLQQLKQNSVITELVVVRRGGGAIGFVTAATAAAWAGAPAAPGYCWYYTDPGRTQGFWDVCPQ